MTLIKGTLSLKWQLLLTTLSWSVATLVLVAVILVSLFNAHIKKRFDEVLIDQVHDLVAAAEYSTGQQLSLARRSSTPKFNEPFSGWYWQVYGDNAVLFQSDSLYSPDPVALVNPVDKDELRFIEFIGPGEQKLRGVVQKISFADTRQHFHIVVTGPQANIEADVWQFTWQLALALFMVACGLVIATFIQLNLALRPLSSLGLAIKSIRNGQTSSIDHPVPKELMVIRTEINNLLEHNSAILERSRLQASNLAHALKNPMSVMQNQLAELPTEQARIIGEQIDKLKQCTHTHLARARLAGAVNQLAALTDVSETLSELVFSMELLYKPRQLQFSVVCRPDIGFRGDQHDLDELLGNIIDNACKWARSKVQAEVNLIDNTLSIKIEDDGPGIAQAEQATVFRPGQRLDETTQGTGLGLNIVQDIMTLYNGDISLYRSKLGGLGVLLSLPGALLITQRDTP